MSEDKVRNFQDKLYLAAKSDPKRRFHSLRDKVIKSGIGRYWDLPDREFIEHFGLNIKQSATITYR